MTLDKHSFSYADQDQPAYVRAIVRTIEAVTGKGKLWQVYREYQDEPSSDEFFWGAAVRKLRLDLDYDQEKLDAIPEGGPLIVVANHPFGIIDGVALCDLISRKRPDHKILINSVLRHVDEAAQYMLPIDFSGTREAIETNLQSRKDARQWLKDGHCLIIFPAGGVADIGKWGNLHAWDRAWQPFFGSLLMQAKPTILPVFIEGQNSMLFQWASVFSMVLRLSLFFRETAARIGGQVRLRFGDPLPYASLPEYSSRDALCDALYERVYALGGVEGAKPQLPPFRTEFKVTS